MADFTIGASLVKGISQGPPSNNQQVNAYFVCGKSGHIARFCKFQKHGFVPQANVIE